MGVLSANGVKTVQHYAPLHYLPFIARARAIMSKPSLDAAGFKPSHLCSMSRRQDVARGFGSYAHMTLDRQPKILQAKLRAGFPHLALNVPVASIEAATFSLCRFNVAMTRQLKRGERSGAPESKTDGRYYLGHQIPIARTKEDKTAMLAKHLPLGTMIEVLHPRRPRSSRRYDRYLLLRARCNDRTRCSLSDSMSLERRDICPS